MQDNVSEQETVLQEQVSEEEQTSENTIPEVKEQTNWKELLKDPAVRSQLVGEFDEEIGRRAQSMKDKELLAERIKGQQEFDNKRIQELAEMDETELGELVKRDPGAAKLLAQRLPIAPEILKPILSEYFGAANLHLLNKLPPDAQQKVMTDINKRPQSEQRFETFADIVIDAVADIKAEEKAKKILPGMMEIENKKHLAETRGGEHSPDLTPSRAGIAQGSPNLNTVKGLLAARNSGAITEAQAIERIRALQTST